MCESQRMNDQVLFLKEDMKETVRHIDKANADKCFELLTTQFEVIQRLYAIDDLKAELGVSEPSPLEMDAVDAPDRLELSVAPDATVEEIPVEEAPQAVSASGAERTMYRVERKLKGAYVVEIEGFIPESILRQTGIEHGDFVYAEQIPAVKEGQNRFLYELAKKSDGGDVPGRIEYKGCPVERDGQLLVLKHSSHTGKAIKLNDVPYSIVLNERDIMQFGLSEGDVVDVAFYESNPNSAAVVWKHEVFDEPLAIKPEPKKPAARKEEKVAGAEVEQLFNGQTICVIGDKPNESSYKRLIEERGGKHLQVEPKWNVRRIQTHVKNSDVVVGLYDASGHTGLEKAKEYCKRYGVPFKMISGTGKSKAIQTAVELLTATS